MRGGSESKTNRWFVEQDLVRIVSAVSVILGGIIMWIASRRTRDLMELSQDAEQRVSWFQLKSLMQFFLVGYGLTAVVVIRGQLELLTPLVGTVFLLGSIFVLKTVSTGHRSIARLEETVALRTAAAEESRQVAEAAVVARTRFMANVSHEIRTPMNAVIGLTTLLLESDLSQEQRSDVLVLKQSGDILLRVVTDVLDFAKLESDSFHLEEKPADLDQLVQAILSMWSQGAQEKGLSLLYERSEDWWPLWVCDSTRIQQILHNLLANAIRFTDSGSVRIRAELTDTGLRFTVQDSGCGIPFEDQEQIFHSFRQSATDRGGTGLGLTICHRLAEAMSGSLTVRSEVGEGSRFYVDLPLRRAEAAAVTIEHPTTRLVEGLNVLLVDDNEVNLKVAKRFLTRLGCVVTTAKDGQIAVDLSASERYDLILMDCQMPVLNGLEATVRIRAGELNHETPIFALTAMATPEELESCLQSGMNGTLTKPLNLEKLSSVLQGLQVG